MTRGAVGPRVLHLAYEDPRAPGSGGGSVRTAEINDRLGDRFDISVVSVAYPGARPYVRHGVHYDVLGPRVGGRFTRQLGYFAALPAYVGRHASRYDLVVEDFGAPISTVGVPRFTRRPVVGVAQWLFGRQKAQQYHLPFGAVEANGLRTHRRVIAVSTGMAEMVRAVSPHTQVDVVENGLPADVLACPAADGPRRDVLYLGRLDVEHKGLDVLLDVFEDVASRTSHDLHLAGDGPDEAWLREEVRRRDLTGRVAFLGRVPAADRFALLGRYTVVAMPSRYESFGMVAAEAAAVGTPTVAFDVPCLRELVLPELRVPAFDVAAYGRVLERLLADGVPVGTGGRLRDVVAHLSWDSLAQRQGEIYARLIQRT